MDAPDSVVRSAMAKAMNPEGLPPMTQKELNRLLGRQYLEAQDRQTQASNTSLQTMRMRQGIASGQSPAIDVREYSGSMYAAPGSYSAARSPTIPGELTRQSQQPGIELERGNSAIERLLGRNLNVMQGAGSAQPMGGPTPSNIFSYTPAAMRQQSAAEGQQLAAIRFASDLASKERKQTIDTFAAVVASGQDIDQFNLAPDIIAEANAIGLKMRKELAPKYPSTKSIVRDGVVYTQRYNPETGEEVGDLIPIRSTQQLPGTAKPQSEGILIPVRDQSGAIVPGIMFDPVTRQYRNPAPMSQSAALASEVGLGGFVSGGQTGTAQQSAAPKPVRTYQQLMEEMRGGSK